jgi:6-phosphofructokinase 2
VAIVTLTLNPTLDLSTSVELIEPWHKLRCDEPCIDPGGGGINVARVIKELGGEAAVVAALGGHVGSIVADAVARFGIPVNRVATRSETRQNFSVSERVTGRQYRFVHTGPRMTARTWQRCLEATLTAAAASAECVVASGSLPPGAPDDAYAELALRLEPTGVPLIVDTSGAALAAVVSAPVRLVKPSVKELAAISGDGSRLTRRRDVELAARTLLDRGRCEIVAVSMGAEGAIFVPRGAPTFSVHAPPVVVTSSIGAGDSMVGGIAYALASGQSLEDAARLGVACGTASVLSSGTSLCHRPDVDKLLPSVLIDR